MSNFRVALISHEFPPFVFGGIGSVCYELAWALSRKGISTSVFCGKSRKVEIEKANSNLEIIRLPYLDIPPRFLWFQLMNLRNLLKHLKNHTIIHAVDPHSGAICAYFKRKLGKTFITSIHGVPALELNVFINSPVPYWTVGDFGFNVLEYPFTEFPLRICLKNSDHIVTCSFTTFNDINIVYRNLNLNNISVIYNGVNFDRLNSITADPLQDEAKDKLSVVFYGRLYWRKGPIYLVKAIQNLRHNFPDIDVQIFGTGPLEGKIRRMISSLGLEDKIRLRGFIPYTHLIKEIKKADAVVLPSLYEAQPVSALEAMACRKPLIAFNFPFAREYAKHGWNALLARPYNVGDLSEKMRLLLSDKKLRDKLSNNAYDYVKRNHNWDTLVDNYLKLYETV